MIYMVTFAVILQIAYFMVKEREVKMPRKRSADFYRKQDKRKKAKRKKFNSKNQEEPIYERESKYG